MHHVAHLWACCNCGHAGMNAWVEPSCVACFFHRRCKHCQTEAHKVRTSRSSCHPYLPFEAPRPKRSHKKDAAGPIGPLKHFKGPPMLSSEDSPIQSLEDSPIPLPYQWNSYTISAAIASEQLQRRQLRDIFLTELDPDAEYSEMADKSTLAIGSSGNPLPNKDYHYEHILSGGPTPSSGCLTPSSECSEYWEENLGSNCCDIDIEILFEIFQRPLDTLFQDWLGEVQCHGNGRDKGSSPSSVSPVCSTDHQRPQSKRKRVQNEENGESDSGPNKLRSAQKRSRKQTPLHKLLACPYFKKDARHHWACCGFGFKKLSYVKSHMYQKHAIPMYCPVCQQTFENVQIRDSHTRERNCEPVENSLAPDGITSEQRDWLGRRGPRTLTEEQQWFRIFEFLFPGHPLPHSAYNDNAFSEDVLNFNNYITGPTGIEVLLERARENPLLTPEREAGLREDIQYGLGQLYCRWAAINRSEIGQITPIDGPSREPGTSSQSTLEDTGPAGIQAETRSDGNSASPVLEITPQEASEDTTSTAVGSLPDDAEPALGSALAFADFELEERKVDEEDVMPPRQLNHEGIAPILDQAPWVPAGLPGSNDIDYDPLNLALPIDFQYENSDLDALFNPPEEIESAELWTANLDLAGSEEMLYLGGSGLSGAHDFLEDLGVSVIGDTTVAFVDGKEDDSKDQRGLS